jgi:hypothetical protein
MYWDDRTLFMIGTCLNAVKASAKPLLFIGSLATLGAGVLTLGVGMDTPWAPWERQSNAMFPPLLFTLASFVATVAFCSTTVVFHTVLKTITNNPDKWWRISGVLFLVIYGIYSFSSGTVEAAIMLTLLHLIVGIPALILLPGVSRKEPNSYLRSTVVS